MRPLASTAKWAAAHRARESARADRLFHDPLADALAGDEGKHMLQASEQVTRNGNSVAAHLAIRTRFCDDLIHSALTQGVGQIVSLGAGMDARAFRLHLPSDAEFYELDCSSVLQEKEEILGRERARPHCRRIALNADLRGEWLGPLRKIGFRTEARSVWIAEGLLQYLEDQEVRRLLEQVSKGSSAGSQFGADVVSGSFFRSPWTKQSLELLDACGMGWRFGVDDPERLLAEFGWHAQVSQLGEEGADYGRWSLPVYPREQQEIPRFYLVRAQKQRGIANG